MITINHVILPLENPVTNTQKLCFCPNELTCICGVSGSGKTTFLYFLGLLDDTIEGDYIFDGKPVDLKNEKEKADYRKHEIGYVFQEYNLLNHLTIKENLLLSAKLNGKIISDSEIRDLLDHLQLSDKTGNESPDKLSGGEKQRVAIGMALIKEPKLLILDEPTSALDKENAISLIHLLQKLAKERSLMIVIATHSQLVKNVADRIYEIKDHQITMIKGQYLSKVKENPSANKKSLFSSWQYVIHYFCKFKKSKLLLTGLCSIVITLFILSTAVAGQIIAKQETMISSITNNEIIVSNYTMGAYFDVKAEPFSDEALGKIKSMHDIEKILPFSVLISEYHGKEIVIQPYTEAMNNDAFKNSNNNIYISYDLAMLINRNDYPFELSLDLQLPMLQKKYAYSFEISSSLESIQANRYDPNQLVIYVNEQQYALLEHQLYELNEIAQPNPNMLLVYTKTYSLVYQVKTALGGLLPFASIHCDFIDLSSIKESMETSVLYMKTISVSLYLIVFLMLITIYSRYIVNREYEFCLLRANGLTTKAINALILEDIFIQSLLLSLLTLLLIIVFCSILNMFSIIQQINYISLIIPIYATSLGILIVPAYISIKKVNQLSPSKFLRT